MRPSPGNSQKANVPCPRGSPLRAGKAMAEAFVIPVTCARSRQLLQITRNQLKSVEIRSRYRFQSFSRGEVQQFALRLWRLRRPATSQRLLAVPRSFKSRLLKQAFVFASNNFMSFHIISYIYIYFSIYIYLLHTYIYIYIYLLIQEITDLQRQKRHAFASMLDRGSSWPQR